VKEASLYDPREEGKVRCRVCAHRCLILPGKRGLCGVRENREGLLYSLVYGKPIAVHVDPIEKKPLFHFLPGSASLSLATVGCNFRCLFCQNAEISQVEDRKTIPGRDIPPEEIVEAAKNARCLSISYTYTEPTVFFEYARDIAFLADAQGLKNVFVTNGYMTGEVLEALHPHLHAANVDLKAFDDAFYRTYCGARLQPVLDTLRTMKRLGIWVEVTTLIIPTLNDGPESLRDLARFIAEELGPETPWHISRFHPTYRLTDLPVTPLSTLKRAWEIGKEVGLYYVYTGNVPGDPAEKTYCRSCNALLLDRIGFSVRENRLKGKSCPRCGTPWDGFEG
jgi:pyruvate formate lyase activating enzyme